MDELRVSSVKMPEARDGASQDLLFDDGIDPFHPSPQDAHKMHHQLRTSPKSPVDGWDHQSTASSSDASRRTSLQRNPDYCIRPAAGRLSLDHFQPGAAAAALRQQQRPTSLLGQPGRHSVDLAGEVHLQQLRLAAIQAQLQLQQAAALQSLAAAAAAQQQHGGGVAPSSVEHLAHALAQLQLSNSGAVDHQSLLLPQQQPLQQPTLAQVMMQKMLMQQQQQQQFFGQSLGRSHSYPMPENVSSMWGEALAADPHGSPMSQQLGNDPSRTLSAGDSDGFLGFGEQTPFHQRQHMLP